MAEEKGTEVRHEWVGVCCTATQKPGAGQPRTVSFNLFPSLCEKAAEAVPSIPHSCPPLLRWVPGCGAARGAGRGRQHHQHH